MVFYGSHNTRLMIISNFHLIVWENIKWTRNIKGKCLWVNEESASRLRESVFTGYPGVSAAQKDLVWVSLTLRRLPSGLQFPWQFQQINHVPSLYVGRSFRTRGISSLNGKVPSIHLHTERTDGSKNDETTNWWTIKPFKDIKKFSDFDGSTVATLFRNFFYQHSHNKDF